MPDDTGTITPPVSSAPPAGSTGGKFTQWYQSHKGWVIGGGIAVIAGLAYLIYRHDQNANNAANAANSSTSTTGGVAGGTGSYTGATTGTQPYSDTGGYGGDLSASDLAGMLATLEQQIAAKQIAGTVPTTSTTTSGTTPAKTTTTGTTPAKPAAATPSNPYPVGTRVTSNETITQSVFDQPEETWLDVTSMGGLYTSGAHNAAGSAYGKGKTGNWTVRPTSGVNLTEVDPTGKTFAEHLN